MDNIYRKEEWMSSLVPEAVYRKNTDTAASIYKDYCAVIDLAGLGPRNKKKLRQVIDEYTSIKWMYACKEEWILLVLAAVTGFFVNAFETQIRYAPAPFRKQITYENLCARMDCVDLLRPGEKKKILAAAGFAAEIKSGYKCVTVNYMDIVRRYRAA